MAIGSVTVKINDTVRSAIDADAYVVAYHAERNEFGQSSYYDPSVVSKDSFLTLVRKLVKYGEFFLIFLSKEAIAAWGDMDSDLETLFGAIRYEEARTDANSDYWIFARRGDMTFVPREGVESRNGRNVAIEIHTSLFEQYGDDSVLHTPITFAGKKKGTFSPKAHRLMQRLTLDNEEAITNTGVEVEQEEYNKLIRPDMDGVIYDSLSILNEDFLTDAIVSTAIPTGSWAAQSGAAKSSASTSGLRQFLGNLVLGPSAFDFSVLNEIIPNTEPTEAGYDAPATTKPVFQKDVHDKTGFVLEARFATTQEATSGVGGISAKRFCISAYRNSENTSLFWNDGLGITIRPTLMDGDNEDPTDEYKNVFISDNSTERGGADIAGIKYVIKPNTIYNVRMLFNEAADSKASGAITLSVWIWEDGAVASPTPKISIGSYVPTKRRHDILNGRLYDQSTDVGVGAQSLSATDYLTRD